MQCEAQEDFITSSWAAAKPWHGWLMICGNWMFLQRLRPLGIQSVNQLNIAPNDLCKKGWKKSLEVAEQQVEELQRHFKNKEDQRRHHLQQFERHLLAAEKELEILERMAVEDSTASRSEAREWLETGKLSKVPDAVAMSDSESDTLDDTSDIAPIEWPKEEPQISPMCIVDSVPEVLPLTLQNPGASGPMIGQALPVNETNEPGTGSKLFWAHFNSRSQTSLLWRVLRLPGQHWVWEAAWTA